MNKIKQRNEIDSKYKWSLDLVYPTRESLGKDIKEVKEKTKELKKLEGHILDSDNNLLKALDLYMMISRINSKLYVYANMKFHEDTRVNEYQVLTVEIDNLLSKINEELAFINPELLSSSYDLVKEYIKKNKNLERYSFYLEDLYRTKEHVLPKEQEELLARFEDVLSSSSDIFDMINNTDITFGKIKDESGKSAVLTNSNYSKYLESSDRRVRKDAFKKLYKSYISLKNTCAKCLASDIKTDTKVSETRGYKSVLEMSLFYDNISSKLYDKLTSEVSNGLNTVYKYIDVRKEVLGLDKVHMYDLYTPLVKEVNNSYTFEEAKEIVLKALEPLGEEYHNLLLKAFDERWIDVYYNEGKKTGAYSWGSYDTKPYLLLNYEGTLNDVSTLAHELGHSIHSYYSNHNNEYHDSSYPIFLAEIASTVNEMLLNRYLYKNAKTKEEKLFYLNDLLDSFRTTLIRQTMFAEFEKITHDKEKKGIVLTEEEFSKIYLKLNKKYYGKNICHDKEIKYEWMRIPHFYTSFYVYKYATGISIATKIVSDILNNKNNAKENYIEFLKSGGNNYPLEILKKVNIDIVNDDTIESAMKVFNDTLEEFIKVLNS